MSDDTTTIPIRRIQSTHGMTVAHPDTREPLHLISIVFPNGDILDNVAFTNTQLSEHISRCNHLLSEALNHEVWNSE